MQVLEITGTKTGIARDGVNFLEPTDAYQFMEDGYIYRQVLQSRLGFTQFSLASVTNNPANLEADGTRIMGIFEFNLITNEVITLVASKLFLYRYNDVTNLFDQIPFISAVPPGPTGFGIVNNEDYVSGTTWPFADGRDRFVLTGRGMSDVWYYDPTPITGGVARFTNLVDNPLYLPPINDFTGVVGVLKNALHVVAFTTRLNFFAPTIDGETHYDEMIYSGTRNNLGAGDQFSIPGSGFITVDPYYFINCAYLLGNVFIIHCNRATYALDVNNADLSHPYVVRKIPSQLGSDGAFSFASWFDNGFAVGQTGLINTDGRQQKRFDDKIPYFTRDEMEETGLELTYGGFDRFLNQFMFSYQESGSMLVKTQDKNLIYNYEEESWAIYNQRFSCFGQSTVGQNLAWNDIYEANNPAWLRWDTTEDIWNKIGLGQAVQKTLAGDNFGFVYQLNETYNDYNSTITGITNASQAVITCNPQGLIVGDLVSIINVTGMVQINDSFREPDTWPIIVAISPTTITVNVNSTNFIPYVVGGTVSKIIRFSAQTIPFNPFRPVGFRVFVGYIEFLLDTNAGFLNVTVYADGEESPVKGPTLIYPQGTLPKTFINTVENMFLPELEIINPFYTTNLLTVIQDQFYGAEIIPTSLVLTLAPYDIPSTTIYQDDGAGNLFVVSGPIAITSGTVNYISGLIVLNFAVPVAGPRAIFANFLYTYTTQPAPMIKDRAWVSMAINDEADFFTFKMTQDSSTDQVRLYSMRIHYMQGGLDSG